MDDLDALLIAGAILAGCMCDRCGEPGHPDNPVGDSGYDCLCDDCSDYILEREEDDE